MALAQDTYELFRLSLLPRAQQGIEVTAQPRIDYIRQVFSEQHTFTHHGQSFVYASRVSSLAHKEILIGAIGRPFERQENAPPEEGFTPITHMGWRATAVLIDPRDHQDGQKIAVLRDAQVGAPGPLLAALVAHCNSFDRASAPYEIVVEPIFDGGTFWEFVAAHAGDVTSVTFRLVAPNMFDNSERIDQDLRDFRDRERASHVDITLSNPDGLDTHTDRVREAVTYAERGGGAISAKAKGRKSYNSKKRTRVVKTPAGAPASVFARALAAIERLFQ